MQVRRDGRQGLHRTFSVGSAGGGEPSEPEVGRLHVDGLAFKREDGSTFPWRGFSDFSLFHRFIRGEDIDGLLAERAAIGANLLRVFGHYNAAGIGAANGLGALDRSMYGPADVHAFYDVLEAAGFRCEWVLFADDADLNLAEGQAIVDEYAAVLSRQVVEVCNEPDDVPISSHPKNIGFDYYKLHLPSAWVYAYGSYNVEAATFKHGSYVTYHTDRKPDWPRTPRSLAEIRDDINGGTHCPVVADEPTGAAEVPRGDSRSSTPDDFAYYAACAAQMGAGATFHSDDGIASRLLGPVQTQCADAFFAALRYVPVEAQFAPYVRGGANNQNVGDLSVIHHDLEEGVDPAALRTYHKAVDGFAYYNRIRALGITQTNPGWHQDEEPLGVVGIGKAHR